MLQKLLTHSSPSLSYPYYIKITPAPRKMPLFVNVDKVMQKINNTNYRGPIDSAILDWSGTIGDSCVWSVSLAMQDGFKGYGVPLELIPNTTPNKIVRRKMGFHKRIHIRDTLAEPDIRQLFYDKFRRHWNESDVDAIFQIYEKKQIEYLNSPTITKLLPHVKETVSTLQNQYHIKIGATTGFLKSMQDPFSKNAAIQGYKPDVCVASDEVPRSRSFGDSMWANMIKLGSANVNSVVKVDDTKAGIYEALNAGTFAVGFSPYNNFMGEQFDSIEEEQRVRKEDPVRFRKLLDASNEHLMEADPHFIMESFDQLTVVIDIINDLQKKN